MTNHAETPLAIIHRVADSDPHRALLAAVLRLAVTDAIGHDLDAARWLQSPACANLLAYLIPNTSGMSAEQLQAHLVARLPAVVRGAVKVPPECVESAAHKKGSILTAHTWP